MYESKSVIYKCSILGLLRRCVNCRSRGDLGSCKDPFTMNSTAIEMEKGVDTVPCASGWCGKIIERHGLNNGKHSMDTHLDIHIEHCFIRNIVSYRIWYRHAKALFPTWTWRRWGTMCVYRVELQKGVYVPLLRGSMQWNDEIKHLQWFDSDNAFRFTTMVHLRTLELNRMYIIV